MIDRAVLTAELKRLVLRIEDDLRARAATVADIDATIAAQWEEARTANRTRLDAGPWRETLLTQVAVGWVLGSVFIRFSEDNALLPTPLLSGPGERLKQAVDSQTLYFRAHPADGERAFLTDLYEQVSRLPGLGQVFGPHNPYRLFGPSDDGARAIIDYWREVDPETGALRRPLIEPGWDTRFLGDLYQDLSEAAKKQYALLQTPDFVEEFILDRTLEPALDEFGLDGFRMIDPACGSGHFLLGTFTRLFDRWMTRAPQEGPRAAAERALKSAHGVDLNPFAVAIARFRLLVAAMKAADVPTLAEAPKFTLQVATGDSLLHGPPPGQQVFTLIEEDDPATRHLFATEDGSEVKRILSQHYHAVVANPPYITPKDPAANDAYRRRYKTCHRQYSLAVPFMERLFDLAERGADGRPAGFVGQITANSFMKREFGKPLIEHFLARDVDLTHVIDTSGAYIPGHGTPTVILLGRNRGPVGSTVRAVMGIRGEPSKPADPRSGLVWTAVLSGLDVVGSASDYVSVADITRTQLAKHPWSLQGGGADAVKLVIEAAAMRRLGEVATEIGFGAVTREDEVFRVGAPTCRRIGVARLGQSLPLVAGEEIRDWAFDGLTPAIWPYSPLTLQASSSEPVSRFLWPWKAQLSSRVAYGNTQIERGLAWFEYSMFFTSRFRTPLSIAFAFVATHNHFVLDRGGKVFKQSAPVIKLPAGASEADHLALAGLLNSSTACFWMKQMMTDKGGAGAGNMGKSEAFRRDYEFDGTKLKRLPIAEGDVLPWSEELDRLATAAADLLPEALCSGGLPSRHGLDEAKRQVEQIRRRMVWLQEELDWQTYSVYGLTADALAMEPGCCFEVPNGSRAFEIALARDGSSTEWFRRNDARKSVTVPAEWPFAYRALVERRLELIESDPHINLIERPEYKRRWNWESWESLEERALQGWLLDRLEGAHLWAQPQLRSVARLADQLATDADFVQVASLYRKRPDVDLGELVAELVRDQAVPYLAAWRYTESGLRNRAVWEQTWALQRREDAGEDVGTIPVPPKYGSGDFANKTIWSLRGKLDVPKERFISYPGLSRDSDPSLLVGWAGWDHLQQATALAAWYEERRTLDGWTVEQLCPILAGLAELVPWLQQWHNDVDPATGQRLGDFFAEFVTTECHTVGLTPADLSSWKPPAPTKGGRRRKAAV